MNYQRTEYPRPQFRRGEWQSLNGEWEFAFDDEKQGELKGYPTGMIALDRKINVPFVYQSVASGIGDITSHETVWYRRTFAVERKEENMLLCFNGCDYETSVWVNGSLVVTHTGAYTAFKADITKYLQNGENVIVVKCYDPISMSNPRGKQIYLSGGKTSGCLYVPSTGIWQSVWIESFKKDCIDCYTLLSDADEGVLYGDITTLYALADKLKIAISYEGKQVTEQIFLLEQQRTDYLVKIAEDLSQIKLWSPVQPNLYYVDYTLLQGEEILDVCHTRIGVKKIETLNGKILLNGKPFYQKLVLDQGYWKDTDLTPPSAEELKKDIELSKQMGFNGARKHQKIEDPYFCYYAEELGFVTWCEMPSAYEFCDREIQALTSEWAKIVAEAKNCTSNIFYVPLNESWGVGKIVSDYRMQCLATSLYYQTKAIDPTRLVSTNDGWENLNETDIVSIHDYSYDDAEFQKKYIDGDLNTLVPTIKSLFVNGAKYKGQPILFSEFGGVAMQTDATGENWGYGKGANTAEEFYKRIEKIVKGIMRCPFQGYCFTQLTDVQQEVNGLLDVYHKPKFDLERIKKIFNQ